MSQNHELTKIKFRIKNVRRPVENNTTIIRN